MNSSRTLHQVSVAWPASPSTKCRNSQLKTPLAEPPPATNTPPALPQEEPIAPATKVRGFPKIWEGQGAQLRWSSSSNPAPPLVRTSACPGAGPDNRPLPQKVHFKPLCPCSELQILGSRRCLPRHCPARPWLSNACTGVLRFMSIQRSS